MKRQQAAPYKRAERVAEQISKVISKTILEQMADPRVTRCNITLVQMSDDLKYAKVYFSLVEQGQQMVDESQKALSKAEGFFKKIIGSELRLRYTPALRFVHDVSMERGQWLSTLIDKAVSEDIANHPERESEDETDD